MSKKEIPELSRTERVEYARKVKSLRQSAGMTQQELADAAGVSRQTVNTLESGDKAPHSDSILRVLRVFGIDAEEHRFSEQTELWLHVMGALIEAIPESRQHHTVNRAILVLSDGVSGNKNVTPIRKNVDKTRVDLSKFDRAASNNHDSEEPDTP